MSEREIHRREVSVAVGEGDGRTLVARLVPYGEIANVDDGRGPYREMFVRGAFKAQMRAADKIKAFLNYRHSQAFGDQIGHAAKIEDREDGLYGEMRVKPGQAGDDALHFVREGLLDRLSIEFYSLKDDLVGGVLHRLDARLMGVALVPHGAYPSAEILAVREEVETPEIPEQLRPKVMDPALVERIRSLGVSLPQRYEAHPDTAGTPSTEGTPESGTRQPQTTDGNSGGQKGANPD